MSRRDAVEAAARLLVRHRVETIPVPLENIAEVEGAIIVREAFSGDQSGFVYRDGMRRIIGINSTHSYTRQRFTLAHEIGHMILHQAHPLLVDREINNRDRNSSLAIDPQEIEANAFAAALLMPDDAVLAHLQRAQDESYIQNREELISHLARKFDVSTEAMGYRLINLGIYS